VLELKWYASVVVHADDVKKLGESTHAIKKNRQLSVVTSTETGLAVNTAKTKNMIMCLDQYIGQNHNIK
jgi:hypothetical protein